MDTNTPNTEQDNRDGQTIHGGVSPLQMKGEPVGPRRNAPEAKSSSAPASIAGQKATPTRVVQQEKDLLLVEWHTGHRLRRAWVTADMVEAKTDNAATVRDPGEGIPYGVDWSRLVELHTTPADVEEELHARGIWTIADLRSNPVEVVAAIQAAYGFSRAHLLQAAERYEEKLKTKETS